MAPSCRLSALLLVALGACGALAAVGHAMAPQYASHRGCEIHFTASFNFEDDEFEDDKLGGHDIGSTQGGSDIEPLAELASTDNRGGELATSTNNVVRVRVKLSRFFLHGERKRTGQPGYFRDNHGFGWEVWVSHPRWEFKAANLVYSLLFNNSTSFHLADIVSHRSERLPGERGRVSYGVYSSMFPARAPPEFVPADPITPGMPVWFTLLERAPIIPAWHAARTNVKGWLRFQDIGQQRPALTMPYTVNFPQSCLLIADRFWQ